MPGHHARLMAVGTKAGTVILWNVRGPVSGAGNEVNELYAVRHIVSGSPQISCVALSSLLLVVGGNDGVVAAWDPLGSSTEPIRTLNSRFSSRARRRLVQAEASAEGVGINLFAAGAVALDPDPTVLRGVVTHGTFCRYWEFDSSPAGAEPGRKRKTRRPSERRSSEPTERFSPAGRGSIMGFIATEEAELRRDAEQRAREASHLRGRFGVGIAGLSEDETLQYAELISRDYVARPSPAEPGYTAQGTASGPEMGAEIASPAERFARDMERALRLSSLETSPSALSDAPTQPPSPLESMRAVVTQPVARDQTRAGPDGYADTDDALDYVLQLSLAEARSLEEASAEAGSTMSTAGAEDV